MNCYADIMAHGRYRLRAHRAMTVSARAAQFSAFAALSGFDDEISETARLTDPFGEMAEDDLAALNAAFRRLLDAASERPAVTVTYFQPDAHKQGGAFLSYSDRFRHYDAAEGVLCFEDGKRLMMRRICAVSFAEPAGESAE